ncbi:uncharacterized protein LOC135469380 [Liolophura sinensis]|uniref:uncharacterized protein LOC135469380 n=1 Tax=Liolophura sinensis TaxID=3198878 RepID=UPI003157FBEC
MSSIPQGCAPKPLKSGELDICVKGILSKSWQTKQCYLCPAWGIRPQRIEAYDVEENDGKTAKLWKVFNLQGLKKVIIKHKAGDNHLEVTTKKDKFCFACKDELEINDWEGYLQGLIRTAGDCARHLDGKAEDSVSHDGESQADDDNNAHLFDENILYESADPQMQFEVSVQPNSDTERLQLIGTYLLTITDFTLSLVDKTLGKPLCIWPYKCIRRYGKTPTVFSIEVGRRSTTGPGCFSFHTTKGIEIFKLAQAKLEKMRQIDMLYLKTAGIEAHQGASLTNNDSGIPRSHSVDSDHKGNHNADQDRRSYPVCKHQQVTVDNNKNISLGVETALGHGSAGQLSKKEKKKAEKAKPKEDKKKLGKSKSKEKDEVKPDKMFSNTANLLDRGHFPEHPVMEKVLPHLDPNATSRLKHVERKPMGILSKPSPPPSTVKPELKVAVNPVGKSDGSTPEELYSLPANKSVRARPFPKTNVAKAVERPYEEPDLAFVSGGVLQGTAAYELEDCYDEVEPRTLPTPAGASQKNRSPAKVTNTKPKSKPSNNKGTDFGTYSRVEERTKAWKHQGIENERHIENYNQHSITDDGLYETTEVPPPSHNLPPPITFKDFESNAFVNNNYDHILVPSAKPRLMNKVSDPEAYSTYSQAQVHSPAAKPKVELTNTGQEYEEAVLSP